MLVNVMAGILMPLCFIAMVVTLWYAECMRKARKKAEIDAAFYRAATQAQCPPPQAPTYEQIKADVQPIDSDYIAKIGVA